MKSSEFYLFVVLSIGVPLAASSCGNDNPSSPQPQEPGTAETTPAPVPTVTVTNQPEPTPTVVIVVGEPESTLGDGTYGGDNAKMVVGHGRVEFTFACASGSIDHPVELDHEGGFSTHGYFTPHGGPVPAHGFKSFRAIYYGFAHGGNVSFDVAYRDADGQNIDVSYEVSLGEPAHFTELCALVAPGPSMSPMPSPSP